MKIKKQATSRHESTLSPMIADFVQATASIPLYQILAHLSSFPKQWPFPRGDMHHWIPALNRFDRILELFNAEYGLVDGPQTQPFQRRLLLKGDAEGDATPNGTTDAVLDQLRMAEDGDRELIEHVLAFTRLLLENCGNRSLYSSSGHLDKLLNTTSTSLLKATLRLSLRLAQRYHAARLRATPASLLQTVLLSHYNLNLDKVQKLASPFPKGPAPSVPVPGGSSMKGKEKTSGERRGEVDRVNANDLVAFFGLSVSTVKQEFGGVLISYYEPSSGLDEKTSNSATTPSADGPSTPTPIRRTTNVLQQSPSAESPTTPTSAFVQERDIEGSRSNGPKSYELAPETVASSDIHELLKQGLGELPESFHYELLHKLRVAKTISDENMGREDALIVRLLAIANYGYVLGEKDFYQKLGQQDSDEPRPLQLAYQLSELVHPPGNGEAGVVRDVQTVALNALEALAKHKAKAPDVCTALNVNVNHGVLFYVVRKMVAELGAPEDEQDDIEEEHWREALFSLLNTLPASQGRTGEGMVTAGLLEILVEVLRIRTAKAERNYPKVLNFLDTFVYNLRDAFSALVSANGLEVIADLTAYEVEISMKLAEKGEGMLTEYKTQLVDYQVPFHHQQSLRWLFKFINHMMGHTGGNFDRLMRNLIDSPQLLSGLRMVLSNASIYGSTVWSLAGTILTSFIHNEPTSYNVIAEAGLSEAFLNTVSQGGEGTLAPGILPVAEAISSIPQAFGAICLAEAGMKLFRSSPALLRFFEVFESPVHVKALDADNDIPTIIGQSFDELVRHHPQLKNEVLSSLNTMVNRVVRLTSAAAERNGVGAKLWVEKDGRTVVSGGRKALRSPEGPPQDESNATDVEMQDVDEQNAEVTWDDINKSEADDANQPPTSQYISVLCRFLSGFFANSAMCASYIELNGVESILDIANLPCLPSNFNEPSHPGEDFSRVMQYLVEHKPFNVLPPMLQRLQRACDRLEPLTSHTGNEAFFAPFTSAPSVSDGAVADHGTEYVQSLVTVHTLCNALTAAYQAHLFSHRPPHSVFSLVNLADMYARLVNSLGKLHRSCVWEEILLQKGMPTDWEKDTRIKSPGFGTDEDDDILRIGHTEPTSAQHATESAAEGSTDPTSSDEPARQGQESAQFKNTQTLRFLLSKVPTGIAPFFQSLGKHLLFRRSLDAYQKQCAIIVADQLGQATIDQLEFSGPNESQSVEDRYSYWIVILTHMSQLIVENNTERNMLQSLTLILQSFRNLNGFAVLESILDSFYDTAISIIQQHGDDVKGDNQPLMKLSLGGIKIILAFYSLIINAKVVYEAPQTTAMQTRQDRDRERADAFQSSQFLVELRYAVIKPVQKIWNSELMDKATTSIVKASINILKTVLEGDQETAAPKTADRAPKRVKPTIRPWKPRHSDYLQRLREANYDQDLAEEALFRCCDSLNSAREYCQIQTRDARSRRNPLPEYEVEARAATQSPSRAEVVVPEPRDNISVSTAGEEGGDGDDSEAQSVEMEDDEGPPESEGPRSETPVPEAQPGHITSSKWGELAYLKRMKDGNAAEAVGSDDLDQERSNLRTNLIVRSLDILSSHVDVTFELADLISAAVAKAPDQPSMRADFGSTMVISLFSLQSNEDSRANGAKIASYAHLLALVIQDKDFYDAVVDSLKESFPSLLEFIKVLPDQPPDESSPWVGQVLVIIERLLAEDQLPPQIHWTPPTGDERQELSVDQLPEPIIGLDQRHKLLDAIIEILPKIQKDESLALSVTRVLVMLTRTRKLALRLAEKRNIQRLFLMVKQLAGVTNEGLRSAFMLVLRHIIEDDSVIRQIMRSEIRTMFESRDRRQTDTTGYTRQMYYLALRAPELFVEITNEMLQLAKFDHNQRPQTLVLKKEEENSQSEIAAPSDEPDSEKPKDTDASKSLERTKTADLKLPVVETSDGIVHYLLCELLAYKDVDDKSEPPKAPDVTAADRGSESAATRTAEQNKSEKPEFKAEDHKTYIYRCFVLKCLAELLQSYNRTKVEFINFSRKADPYAATPSKPRSGVLNYLLNALVPVGSLNHEGDVTLKKKVATANCAIDVIVSLCAKTGEHVLAKSEASQLSPYSETEADLFYVRKFVLEHTLKAFKDACASDEPLDLKYSRLLGISDIFSKMVSQRADGTMLSQNSEWTPTLKQMAKIMYEKNFITTLTLAIADIDLNFPNAKRAVKYILKPLRWLCAVAVDLSTHYDTSSTPDASEDYDISSASDDDLVDATREETPDLFRNSTLGMYEPTHESDSNPSGDEEDEEQYGDDFGEEMEYEEDIGDDDVVSDEDVEMDDMGPMEGLPGDIGMDVEVMIGEEGEGTISDDNDLSDDEEDEDDVDEDEDDDDMDDIEEIEELEEVDGDGENASLADDGEDSWSGDNGGFDVDLDPASGHPLGFVLDPPQVLEHLGHMHAEDDFLEDDMQEDEDDDEDDFDEEGIVYDPGREDDEDGMDAMGWGWDDPQPPTVRHTHRFNPWMFPSGPGDRILVPAFRTHNRPGAGARMTDDGVNPLLQRTARSARDLPILGGRNEGMSDWVHGLETRGPRLFAADSPVSFISNLLNAMSQGTTNLHQHNGTLHLSINNLPIGLPPPFDPTFRRDNRTRDAHMSRSAREDPQQAVTFLKAFTGQRWQEEARILYGPSAVEKSQRVINSILKLMVPPAMEAAKAREAEKEAERQRRLIEEQERKEREEREAKQKAEQERQEREAAEAAARAAEGNINDANVDATNGQETQAMEGLESAGTSAADSSAAAPSEEQARVMYTIRGRTLDITDLGIDMDYLEALPEDMREEVLAQQIQQHRAQAQEAGAEPTDIDQQFLDALPPEIRAELLQQEAQDRRRRERDEQRRRQTAGSSQRPVEEMDPASFLATLEPSLRQAVLMDQDDEILAQLPPEISAEARALGGDRRLHQFNDILQPGYRRGNDRRAIQDEQLPKRKARPCVQMLDKAGVATLLRLMFIPQTGSAKVSLSHILRNVCENRQNRAEVISILLSILQDGSADVTAVERSFSQLSIRAKQDKQQGIDKTPKGRKNIGALTMSSEVSPLMVVQQCLHTLWQLTEKNPPVWSFFLTEHETAVGFKNRGNRKGKAKETKATKYPLNALLGLLDRKLIIESSSIMEQLTTLLHVITRPLQVLKKDKEKQASDADKKETEPAAEDQVGEAGTAATEPQLPVHQQAADTGIAGQADAAPTPEVQSASSAPKVDEPKAEEEDKAKRYRSLIPPDVPETNLRLVAKILAARECNSRVFQETLSVISNLSPIPGAKEVFGKELLGIAQDLARSALNDLSILTIQVSKAATPTDVQGMALSKFSPASSDQAKLLRALTALDYLFDPARDNKDRPNAGADALEPSQKEDILLTLYEDSTFGPLWNKLSECLTIIRQRGNMLNIATILLPLIEALMVICKNTTLKEVPLSKMLSKEFVLSSPPPESKMESLFFTFTDDHRKILNDLVRQNPKLMSGTFSLLVKNSKVLEFDNKRNYFNRKLHSRSNDRDRHPHPPLQLSVRRDQVFHDSFKSLYFKTADEMKYGKLSIRFHGEEGVDAGGVTREWFQVISRQMFNPDYALFVPVASDRTTFHPNRLSAINEEHLMFFKFIGRIIGKALYEGRVLDCHFSRAVYKRILSRPVNLKDMETLDLEYHKSLQWMLNNDITDIITETFSTDVEAFGETQTVDLIENGRNIPVTEANKHEYVRLVTEHRLTGSVHEQLENFLKGFHDIVPADLVSIFSEQELELLISGLPDINVDDWKNNTEYHNYTAASPQIQWFWRAVRSFDKEERAKLLQFVTGTSKVPLNGFKELEGMNGFSRFNIHRDYGSKERLPSSHTCFNQLDLPEYDSYEDLRKQLYTAMTAGSEYFGFA